jgi:hypothetical protein
MKFRRKQKQPVAQVAPSALESTIMLSAFREASQEDLVAELNEATRLESVWASMAENNRRTHPELVAFIRDLEMAASHARIVREVAASALAMRQEQPKDRGPSPYL